MSESGARGGCRNPCRRVSEAGVPRPPLVCQAPPQTLLARKGRAVVRWEEEEGSITGFETLQDKHTEKLKSWGLSY